MQVKNLTAFFKIFVESIHSVSFVQLVEMCVNPIVSRFESLMATKTELLATCFVWGSKFLYDAPLNE